MMSQTIENVVKQGYLKRGHYGANRFSVLFRRNDVNKWFVFTIRRGVPFLEYYDSDVDVFTQQPINSFNLSHCQNIRSMGNSNPPSFCIVCPDRVIELVASSRVQMVEWVNEVEASLVRLGILKNEVVDHVYSVCPAVVRKPRVSIEVTEEAESELASVQSSGGVTDTAECRRSIDHSPQTLSSSFNLPQPPPRSSVLKQRTSSLKPSSNAPLASGTSSSFHSSSHSALLDADALPPPLPARLSSWIDKASSRTESNERTVLAQAENITAQPEGSNDSDFVSPEVIAELRLQRETSKKMLSSHIVDSENSCDSTSDPLAESSSEIYMDMSRSDIEHNTEINSNISQTQLSQLVALTLEPSQDSAETNDSSLSVDNDSSLSVDNDSSLSVDNDSSLSVDNDGPVYMPPQCPETLNIAIRPEEVMENMYSVFPCQQETVGDVIDNNDLCGSVVTQKPVAVPRKTIPKASCYVPSKTASCYVPSKTASSHERSIDSDSSSKWPTADEMYNNLPPAVEKMYNNLPPAVEKMYNNLPPAAQMYNNFPPAAEEIYNNLPPVNETYINLQAHDDSEKRVSSGDGTIVLDALNDRVNEYDNCTDASINLKLEYNNVLNLDKDESEYNNVLNVDKDGRTGACHSQPPTTKDNHLGASKDENENFYGLVFDIEPPSTKAPPIPPLPAGHYSHPSRAYSSESSTAQDPWTSSSSAKNPAASSVVQSAFHAAASNKYTSLPSEPTPPHLLPSNKYTSLPSEPTPPLLLPRKTNSFHASMPSSCATSLESRHKNSNLYHALSLDDQPPAIPSRGSQSFFIKRPQITGMSTNKLNSSEGSNDQSLNTSTQSQSHPTDSMCPRTEQAASVSSLSRKMLLDRAHSLHTVVSLKQTQAEILQTEITMPNVTLTITQKAGHGIALVDWNSFSCVVGWNQKDFPSLHGKLHLGDLIFSINNVRVTSAETAQKLLKQASCSNIELMLHRMPYAKVFAIHRNAEGQSLGIKRNGGTGEIIYVDPNGLAAQHGLTPYAQSVCGAGRSNWFLVEINNRPLSLFFTHDEIDHRLSAVGREISLVVQPCDFIFEIRRRFKKLRNYKQYITQ